MLQAWDLCAGSGSLTVRGQTYLSPRHVDDHAGRMEPAPCEAHVGCSSIYRLENTPLTFSLIEEQLVLQSRVRINAGLTLLALGVYTQLALVLKKKQFERLRL